MPVVDVYNTEKIKVSEIHLNNDIFDVEVRTHLIADVAIMQQANRRTGIACTKNRSRVRGGGAKPWRQKGTGRARAGSRRSPLWVGGGTVFGPTPKDYSYSLPKKARKQALKSAMTLKLKEGEMIVLDSFQLEEIKTRDFVTILNKLGVESVLIVDDYNFILERSARNVRKAKILRPEGINVYDIIKYDNLVLVSNCIEKIETRLMS